MNRQLHDRPRRPRGAKPQPHDIAFKSLYGFGLMVLDLLKIVLPQELFDRMDPDTLERLPAEWLSPDLERRHGDCVWRARIRSGGSLIVLIEFQRSLDRLMPVRVASYASMLLLDLAKRLVGPGHRELRSAFVEWVWHSVAPDLGADAPLLEPELLRIAELGEVREVKTLMMKSMVDHWLAEGRMEGRSEGLAEGEASGVRRGRSEEQERLRQELSALKLDPETAARVSKLLDRAG